MGFKVTNQDGSVAYWTSGSTQWAISGTNLYSTNAGNLGIGTANPGYKLTVAENSTLQLDVSNAGYASLRVGGIEAVRIKP